MIFLLSTNIFTDAPKTWNDWVLCSSNSIVFFSLFFSVICFEVLNISANQFLVIQTRDTLKFNMTLFICYVGICI